MKNNLLIKSTLILSGAAILSKILGSIFRIPLQNIAGDEVLGIFSLVYPFYMVALTLSVAGIPLAISILISNARASGNQAEINDIFYTSSVLSFLFGAASFLAIYLFSHPIAYLLGGASTRPALIIVSATLLIAPYMAVYRGFFQGYADMKPTAVSQVIEQFVRVGIILLAAFYLAVNGFENAEIAGGVMAGSIIGAAVSLIYLRTLFQRSLYKVKEPYRFDLAGFNKTGKRILKLSLPICIGALTMALLNVIDSLTVPLSLKSGGVSENSINYLYGIYGRGLALVQILTVFSTSIVLPLIPAISSKLALNDRAGAKDAIGFSVYLIMILSLPAAVALPILVDPINFALFTNTEGSTAMAIILAGSFLTSLTILGTGILQGIGKAKIGAVIILIGAVMKIFLNIVLVENYGIAGAAISTTLVYLLLVLLNAIIMWRQLRDHFLSGKIMGIAAASIMMGLLLAIPRYFLPIDEYSRSAAFFYVTIFLIAGTLIYTILLIAFKVIGKESIKKFRGLMKTGK